MSLPATPLPGTESENAPVSQEQLASGRMGDNDQYLKQDRVSSGGLSDDPTESGAPVIDPTPFKNLSGGR